MEVAALEVPIRVTGANQAQAGLQGIEQAGRKADQSLKALQPSVEREVAALRRMAAAAREAGQGEMVYQARLRSRLAALRGATSAGVAANQAEVRGFIATAKAAQTTAAATTAVTVARARAIPGIRSLTGNLASLAAMELGVRSGLGSTAAILGTFAMGSTLTLGVVAGIGAIALSYRQLGAAAAAAREQVEKARRALEDAQQARAAQLAAADPEAAASIALKRSQERLIPEAQRVYDAAQEQVRRAQARVAMLQATPGDRGQAHALVVAREALKTATLNAEAAESQLNAAQQTAIVQAADLAKVQADLADGMDDAAKATAAEVRNLVALRDAGKAYAPELAALTKHQQTLEAVMVTGTTAQRAWAQGLLDAIKGQEDAAKRVAKAEAEHTRALATLAAAGIATSADLAELAAIQDRLTAATQSGTAEARAQALALLEVVRAARLAAMLPGGFGKADPKLSKTSPPGYRGMQPGPEQFPTREISRESIGGGMGYDPRMLDYFSQLEAFLDPVNSKLAVMDALVRGGADAWVAFWEGVGSGDFDVGNLIGGFARQMSALFAQQAMAALVMGTTPPPLGNPAMLASVPRLLAVSAGFAALAGAAGSVGGRAAAGVGGYGGGSSQNDDYRELTVSPKLRPGGTSSAAGRAATLAPAAPIVVNQTIIGERDPVAQRQIARLTETAARRGYRVG